MKRGLILGRFQPLHMGHLSLFENVIEKKEKIIVCIGSSDKKRTKENPYNALERTQMIESVLSRYKKYEYVFFDTSLVLSISES